MASQSTDFDDNLQKAELRDEARPAAATPGPAGPTQPKNRPEYFVWQSSLTSHWHFDWVVAL